MSEIISFPQKVLRGCGLDVHKSLIYATIDGVGITKETRVFDSFTEDLELLRDWLLENGITDVAMESTGVYWKPVFNVLEAHLNVLLVNARHIKNVPGKKTDKKDSEWLTKLLLSGLLENSFIPPRIIRDLRDLSRYSQKIQQQISAEKNRIHKQLQDANIKVSSVMSDLFGVSGREMLEMMAEGVVDPESLANCAKGSLRSKKELLKKALNGNIQEHHCFMISTHLQIIKQLQLRVVELEQRMDSLLDSYQQECDLVQTIPGLKKKVLEKSSQK